MLYSSMHQSWQLALEPQRELLDQIEQQLLVEAELTPDPLLIMKAFEKPLSSIKVLLIGQDPYPTRGVACGLAFAVSPGVKQPQSLKNLMKELATDLPEVSNGGELSFWCSQGVMLLNSALTTRIQSPGAHAKIWSGFTNSVISALDKELAGKLVCLSLGEHAKKLSKAIEFGEVIQATHPSPLSASRGFFGSRIYSRVNTSLISRGIAPIDWSC
jgi:uracil-DNA glycosylase